MKQTRLDYINGLKGIGAGIVYLCHFVFAFYYGMFTLEPADFHLKGNLDAVIGGSPLNLLFNGNFAVRLFLVMSGYVLCLGYFRTRDKKRLVTGAAKRYLRLVPPILISNVLICLMMMADLIKNAEVSDLTGSSWLANFYRSVPNLWDAVKEAIFGCFFLGTNQYNGVLWTIPFLFLGSLMVYAIVWLVGDKKWRYLVYGVLGAALVLTDYAGMIWGLILCDVVNTQESLITWIKKQKWILWLAFLLGIYLSSYPSGGIHLENTIYGIIPIVMVVPYHLAGAILLVGSAVCLEPVQKFFSWKPFVKLGNISYSLYLVHFPVIASLGCWLFKLLSRGVSYHVAVLIVFVVTTAVTLIVSVVFSKYIEPLGTAGEKYVEQKLRSQK